MSRILNQLGKVANSPIKVFLLFWILLYLFNVRYIIINSLSSQYKNLGLPESPGTENRDEPNPNMHETERLREEANTVPEIRDPIELYEKKIQRLKPINVDDEPYFKNLTKDIGCPSPKTKKSDLPLCPCIPKTLCKYDLCCGNLVIHVHMFYCFTSTVLNK